MTNELLQHLESPIGGRLRFARDALLKYL